MLHSWPKAEADAGEAVWFDLVSPSAEELATLEVMTGVAAPTRADLSEIEMSSRLRRRGELLVMSTPTAARPDGPQSKAAPVGFLLSAQRLITVRYGASPAFESFARKLAAGEVSPAGGLEMFVALAEEIVDHIADGLEHLAESLNALSIDTFHADDAGGRQPVRSNRLLRGQLRQVGRLGDRLSEIRDGLLGLGRIVAFTEDAVRENAPAAPRQRLASLHQDIAALSDYDERLANKVQFVLDAIVGLIGIAQNDIFKVLTIVSIVGIPPTLIAGVYGMNFKNMPEYNWAWGYQYGWAVIILSAVLPLAWFKWKAWF